LCGATPERIYNGFDTRAAEILAGCAAAFLPLEARAARLMAKLWIIPAAVLIGDLFLLDSHILYFGGFGLRGLMAAWVIIALRKGCQLASPLECQPMVYIGQISYGLYLWHYFFISVLGAYGLQSWSRNVPAVAATFLVASISYHVVEQPILRATRNSFLGRPAIPKAGGINSGEVQSRS
jgi:peptidoglycan/LPS O-acetylase OafA/YrhL